MYRVIFVCHNCVSHNKHQRGNEGFVEMETEFTVFSDAVKHVEDTGHWVDAIIREAELE